MYYTTDRLDSLLYEHDSQAAVRSFQWIEILRVWLPFCRFPKSFGLISPTHQPMNKASTNVNSKCKLVIYSVMLVGDELALRIRTATR